MFNDTLSFPHSFSLYATSCILILTPWFEFTMRNKCLGTSCRALAYSSMQERRITALLCQPNESISASTKIIPTRKTNFKTVLWESREQMYSTSYECGTWYKQLFCCRQKCANQKPGLIEENSRMPTIKLKSSRNYCIEKGSSSAIHISSLSTIGASDPTLQGHTLLTILHTTQDELRSFHSRYEKGSAGSKVECLWAFETMKCYWPIARLGDVF